MGKSGAHLPLTLEGENAAGPETRVLELTGASQRFVFVGVAEAPLAVAGPRLFRARDLQDARTTARDRAMLMGTDSDAFNRWEAGQMLAGEIMLEVAGQRAPMPTPSISTAHRRCAGRAPKTIPPLPPRC